MAKASFRWKPYLVFKPILGRRYSKSGKLFFCLFAMVAMAFWNWKLLLATVTGVSIMQVVYLMPAWNWQNYWQNSQKYLTGSNRQFTLAVGSGAVGALSIYLIASIWVNTENHWLATGAILQSFLSVLTFLLLVWQIFTLQGDRQRVKCEQWLRDLTDLDPLKRLIAVRQLSNLAQQKKLNDTEQRQLIEYFRLMLAVEQETLVRNAILENFQNAATPLNNPLQMPLKFKVRSFSVDQG